MKRSTRDRRAWVTGLDPRVPYRLETRRGATAWWGVAVSSYAVAWQLLAVAAAAAGCVWAVAPDALGWRTVGILALPAGVAASLGGFASWGDHLADEPFRWYTPWTPLRAAVPALGYAFGRVRR